MRDTDNRGSIVDGSSRRVATNGRILTRVRSIVFTGIKELRDALYIDIDAVLLPFSPFFLFFAHPLPRVPRHHARFNRETLGQVVRESRVIAINRIRSPDNDIDPRRDGANFPGWVRERARHAEMKNLRYHANIINTYPA